MDGLMIGHIIAIGVLITIGIVGVVLSVRECKRHDEPIKTLARTLCESVVIFSFGTSLGVALTVMYSKVFWVLMAASATMGYLILMVSTLSVLRKLKGREKATVTKLSAPPAMLIENPSDAIVLLQALHRYARVPVMVITREPYAEWVKRTGVTPEEYVWLTRVSHERGVDPANLHVLLERAARFLRENPGGVVYLEGVEYLLLYNDFKGLMKFLIAVKDMAVLHGGHVIVGVTPGALKKEELSLLRREFERADVDLILKETLGSALFEVVSSGVVKKDAGAEGSEGGSGAGKKTTEKARPLRREETA